MKQPTEFLLYWQERATKLYLEDITTYRSAKKPTGGMIASIEIGSRILRMLDQELRHRRAQAYARHHTH